MSYLGSGLNAPTGAWCSLTHERIVIYLPADESQCTYRCVVLPDKEGTSWKRLPGPSQCTYRCVVLPDSSGMPHHTNGTHCLNAPTRCVVLPDLIQKGNYHERQQRLNAPTGAWCSLTVMVQCIFIVCALVSQCTYRCVVLPDVAVEPAVPPGAPVSMHLQVRGAP